MFKHIDSEKCYIGSTVMTFEKRKNHHLWHLRENKHKNIHFQNAWNKYGEDAFEYDILEICEKNKCLEREQCYLNTILFANEYLEGTSSKFKELGYNINPLATGTPNLSKETVLKRTKTFTKYVEEASNYYQKIKSFEIDLDDVPDKYLKMIHGWLNNVPWNKGKKYISTEHLKVPKTKTEKYYKRIEEDKERRRNNSKNIEVYKNNILIGTWRSSSDLYEWSLTEKNNLPIKFTGKIKDKILLPQNVMKSCKTNKPYKGLYFKYEEVPSQEVIFD